MAKKAPQAESISAQPAGFVLWSEIMAVYDQAPSICWRAAKSCMILLPSSAMRRDRG